MAEADRYLLIVEDEALIAFDIGAEMEGRGWRVMGPAGTLSDARTHLRSRRPAVALLDIQLLGETTYALAEDLLSDGAKVVFLTGGEGGERPPGLNACPVLQKPVSTVELGDYLDELTRRQPI